MKRPEAPRAPDLPASPARWIRPVDTTSDGAGSASDAGKTLDAPLVASLLEGELRSRVASLLAAEREIEERLRLRVREVETALRERESRFKDELALRDAELRAAAEEALVKARREGRDSGFREGFEKGAEEGRRLGFEQGRLEGLEEGKRAGRQGEESRWRRKTAEALEVLGRLAAELRDSRAQLLREAQNGVVELAVRIAEKVIDRELLFDPRAALGTARKAVEQIFRGCEVVLQVHPEDAPIVREVLDRHPRWAEDLAAIEVRSTEDVERGGCRLLSGSGIIDATISSQLELIEESLRRAVESWTLPSSPESEARDDAGPSRRAARTLLGESEEGAR